MGKTIGNISEKIGAKKGADGKRQSTFFLTDKALESLKSCMEMVHAPSMNHALEFLLLELGNEVGRGKPVMEGAQPKIIEQAKIINEQYAEFIKKSKSNRKKEEIALFVSLNELQKLMANEKDTS